MTDVTKDTAAMLSKTPFAAPTQLRPDSERVRAYWRGLLRGAAEIPFADDLNLQDLPDLKGRLFLIETFASPRRFRLDLVGADLGAADLAGRFLDETEAGWPFHYLSAQCDAAVEGMNPTNYRREGDKPYSRLVLPLWGDGRISMLLGFVEPG